MRDTTRPVQPAPPAAEPSAFFILACAIACGVTVANLYYAQPLIGPISASLGLDPAAAGIIVTILQIGYVAGLVLVAPLGDLAENRKLILLTLAALIGSLLASAAAPNAALFFTASFAVGITAVATQMIVPVAAGLTPEARRGQVVGTVMSGLLIGILLARPISTLLAGVLGWRAMYVVAAVAIAGIMALLAYVLPRRQPEHRSTYPRLIASLWQVLRDTPVLRRRAAYQAAQFGAFSVFWTAMPVILQREPFSLGHVALAAFLLSGVTGALVAPIAGRLADRGYGRVVTGTGFAAVMLAFVVTWIGGITTSIALMVLAGILLDGGVQATQLASQRIIYTLPAEIRNRLNALFLALFFLGGAAGSALGGYAAARGGVPMMCGIGFAIALAASLFFLTELRGKKSS